MNNLDIKISEHACERFIDRYNPTLKAITSEVKRLKAARNNIRTIFANSFYQRDNSEGILFHNEETDMELIVQNNMIITIFKKRRWKKTTKGLKKKSLN